MQLYSITDWAKKAFITLIHMSLFQLRQEGIEMMDFEAFKFLATQWTVEKE